MHLCPRIVFPSMKQFSNELLPKLVKKTKQLYVLLALVECHFAIASLDSWMSKARYDIFALVIYFLKGDWQPKHITLCLFGPINITRQTLAKNLTKLLASYALERKIIIYVKDEGSNLYTMTTTLKSMVSCDMLGLEESFQGICFEHAFYKACQYVTTKEKFCEDLQYVSIKFAQGDL